MAFALAAELGWISFFLIIAVSLRSTILVHLPRDVALFALGLFTIGFAMHARRVMRQRRAIRMACSLVLRSICVIR